MLTKSRLAKGNYLDMGVSNHRGQTKIHWFPNFNSTCFKHFGWVPNVEMIYPCWVLPNTEKKHWIPWNLITDPFLMISYDHFPTIKPGFKKCLKARPQDIPPTYNPYGVPRHWSSQSPKPLQRCHCRSSQDAAFGLERPTWKRCRQEAWRPWRNSSSKPC